MKPNQDTTQATVNLTVRGLYDSVSPFPAPERLTRSNLWQAAGPARTHRQQETAQGLQTLCSDLDLTPTHHAKACALPGVLLFQ